ncbi:low-affinity potassium transport [Fusarium sporotrichioides]|uniref:Low-affinity potassium transport n=1 Tax=Fusarium sporotrichioides TaxID=5514 RepID=A0A395SRL3_FUSSP|nr:low-affinity potassium transport [Fusarium sporotrichioides]
MYRPPINFLTLHYAYIILMGLFALPILYPYGNMAAIDAWFFGASASTESGLNTIDVKLLKTYQQLYIYFIPILTNLGFINIIVVIVRLYWFKRHLKRLAPQILSGEQNKDVEDARNHSNLITDTTKMSTADTSSVDAITRDETADRHIVESNRERLGARTTTISFDPQTEARTGNTSLYIPGPRARERGQPIGTRVDGDERDDESDDEDRIKPVTSVASKNASSSMRRRRLSNEGLQMTASKSMDRVANVAASLLLLGSETTPRPRSVNSTSIQQPALNDIPQLSRQVTIGRNSHFKNLTEHDREVLGGIEYRTLKLLLKIVTCYFFGLHLFGAICLVGWIHTADAKYTDVLAAAGQDKTWWGFYSAQTMTDNLGFTLTPDSMISFRDAKWPMILMSFLAFAGNTLYPVFLRLTIWTMSKVTPKNSPTQESLTFLLKHPRRCYTLLFPSGPTWILFGIIFALNFVDVLLIILLDLDNSEVSSLPVSARIPAAIFQAASARHTGTSSFNLANVSPAVQLSLLVMMYIAIFPIAISIRASNAYEEKSLGLWDKEESLNEQNGKSYLLTHMKNQLGFDLWYIFLGTFCICISEASRIADVNEPAFSVFSVLFEVTSAYGNVGLSLGYPTVSFSLCGMFGVFGKVVICFMMIRGRHRGLPYALDRAIMLPSAQVPEKSG